MKEDILEQIAEDYFNLQPFMFTKHNIKYRPNEGSSGHDSQLDSVHSDIDILSYNPRRQREIFIVSCKAWQSGFSIAKFKTSIENAIRTKAIKPKGQRPSWIHFRELCSSKWTAAFVEEIRNATGVEPKKRLTLNYWILCTKLTAHQELDAFERSISIKEHFRRFNCEIRLKVKPFEELLEAILTHMRKKETPAVETTHFSRTLQLLLAAGYKIEKNQAL